MIYPISNILKFREPVETAEIPEGKKGMGNSELHEVQKVMFLFKRIGNNADLGLSRTSFFQSSATVS